MADALILMLLAALAVYLVTNALHARERACALSLALCRQSGVQLLDQTVALRRLRLIRQPEGRLGLRRIYSFELSTDGKDRHRGSLSLVGDRLESFSLPAINVIEPIGGANVTLQ